MLLNIVNSNFQRLSVYCQFCSNIEKITYLLSVLWIRVYFLPDPDPTILEITDPDLEQKKGTIKIFFSLVCEAM